MKTSKLLLYITVIFIGFMITCEYFHIYASTFSGLEYSNLISYSDIFKDDDVANIENLSEKYSVTPFLYNTYTVNNINNVDIYANENAVDVLSNNYFLKEGNYNSFFVTDTVIKYHDFNEISNNDNIRERGIYILGDADNISKFNSEMKNFYKCNFSVVNISSFSQYHKLCIITWLIICAFILLILIYNKNCIKKEFVIKCIYGISPIRYILKNIVTEIVIVILAFAINFIIFSLLNIRVFFIPYIIIGLAVVILAIVVINLRLLSANYVEVIKNKDNKNNILITSYVLKLISSVICMLVFASNFVVFFEIADLQKQRKFFDDHEDYYYINTVQSLFDSSNMFDVNTEFYFEYYEKFKPICFNSNMNMNNEIVYYANYNSFDLIKNEIKEINNLELKDNCYLIIPENHTLNYLNIDSIFSSFTSNEVSHENIVTYKNDAKVLTFDQNHINTSYFVKNPYIFLDGRDIEDIKDSGNGIQFSFINDIIFKANENDLKDFYDKHQIHIPFKLENCKDKFYMTYSNLKRITFLIAILTTIILLFETIIIYSTLKIEFDVNAMELSLKKIFGYSLLDRYKMTFAITGISFIISIILSIAICKTNHIGSLFSVISAISIVILLEMLVTYYWIKKLEKTNVNKILKGGSL